MLYFYDAGGRLTGTRTLDKVICYEVDDFDRNTRVIEGDRVTSYTYDALGQVISLKMEDLQGRIYSHETYKYDSLGNQIERSKEVQPNEFATTTRYYHSDNTLNYEIDEEGNKTTWTYDRTHTLQLIKQDPSGRLTTATYDALNRCIKEEKIKEGKWLFSKEILFDLGGNPIQETVHNLFANEPESPYRISKKYDVCGRLIELCEANEKITRYEYDLCGRLHKKIFPDEVELTFQYDALGRCLAKESRIIASLTVIAMMCVVISFRLTTSSVELHFSVAMILMIV